MSCVNIEKCALIIGILSAVAFGLLICITVSGAAAFLYTYGYILTDTTIDEQNIFIFAVVFCFAIISFLFSVLLILGLKKKKPALAKAYYVYTVVMTVLSFMTAVFFWLYCEGDLAMGGSISSLVYCIPHIYIVLVAWKAYKKLERREILRKDNLHIINNQYLFIEKYPI